MEDDQLMTPYPVQYEADYVEQRSRLTTFFRAFMIIPHCIVGIAYGIALFFSLVAAWFAVVITGRYPPALYEFNAGVLRWATQLLGYMLLATDRFPPFGLGENDYPIRVYVPEPQAEYDRVKAFFRLFLIIPWAIVVGIYGYVALFASLAAWFVIVFTGRQPELLQRGVNFYLGPYVKYNGFALLLTDAWPPFEPEPELEPRAVGAGGGSVAAIAAYEAPAAEAPIAPPPPADTGLSSGDPLNPG